MIPVRNIVTARARVSAIDTDRVHALLERDYNARAERRVTRNRRTGRTTARCFSCNRFKRRPSSVCDFCGDDPVGNVSLGGPEYRRERLEFDRAHGWDLEEVS